MKIPIFEPLAEIPKQTKTILMVIEAILALVLWQVLCDGHGLIPGPIVVLKALFAVFVEPGFLDNFFASIELTLKSMGISMLIALTLTYLSSIPIVRPITNFVIQCRYLTLTGLIFLFTLLTHNGSQLKISLLIFGIVPFFVTSLMSIISQINNQQYDLCKTLRFGNWETMYEVIIRGQLDMTIEVMRQNFAISWLMITMVEGLSMSEGGLGVMLIKANKYINLPKVFAILVLIFSMGILFDVFLRWLRRCLFPYSTLQVK
jgi:ABC-type nitrate/sulfonate/bicarbonate transport system permease component